MTTRAKLQVAAPAAWVLAPAGAWREAQHVRPRTGGLSPGPVEGWRFFRRELLAVLKEARDRASRPSDSRVAVPVPTGLSPSTVSLMRRWVARGSAPTWHVEAGAVVQAPGLVAAMFRAGFTTVPVLSATTLDMVTYQQSFSTPLLPPLTEDMVARWHADQIWWATPAGRAWRTLNPAHGATTRTLLECLDSRAAFMAESDSPRWPGTSLTPA